jgi:dephospho-CoA kinase
MHVIGLLGGVACGKSLVASLLGDEGAKVIEADALGHQVLRRSDVKQALAERWGDAVLDQDGEIDRAAVAKVVFEPTPRGRDELAFLERLTHSKIGDLLRERIEQTARRSSVPAIVLDAAVMLKAGWHALCDTIIFVDAPRDVRLQRAAARGWSEEDFAAREAAQESLDEKRRRADVIIDNSGSIESTRAQVERFWRGIFGSIPPGCSSPPRGPC